MTAMTSIRTGYALTEDQMRAVAPSIFATEAHSSRSEKFVPVPTISVLDALRKEGFEAYSVQQAKCRSEGRADYTKHLVRLRSVDAPMPKMDGVWPELLLVNANGGESSYRLMAGAYSFVCANGLIAGSTFHEVNVRHMGNDVIDNVINGTFSVVSEMPRLTAQIDEWSSIDVDRADAELLAAAAHQLRFPHAYLDRDDPDYKAAPIEASRLLIARRYADQAPNLWKVYNRIQEGVIRGGIRGVGMRAGRQARVTTKAVKGIDQSVALNRALTTLIEAYAALRAA